MKAGLRILGGAVMLSLAFAAAAQKPIAYPAKGQSPEQQNRDDGECYVWAKQNTGIDPASPPAAAAPAQGNDGTVAKNVAGGALGGAAIGAIAGDTGKGAGIGAVVGIGRGLMKRNQQQQQQAAQQVQGQQQIMNTYYRAWGACMSGRGYSIM